MDDAAKKERAEENARATWLLEEVLGKGFDVTAGLKTEAEGSDELYERLMQLERLDVLARAVADSHVCGETGLERAARQQRELGDLLLWAADKVRAARGVGVPVSDEHSNNPLRSSLARIKRALDSGADVQLHADFDRDNGIAETYEFTLPLTRCSNGLVWKGRLTKQSPPRRPERVGLAPPARVEMSTEHPREGFPSAARTSSGPVAQR